MCMTISSLLLMLYLSPNVNPFTANVKIYFLFPYKLRAHSKVNKKNNYNIINKH